MISTQLLNSHNLCQRRSWLERSWEKRLLSTSEGLIRSVEVGLESNSPDFPQIASDHFMELATSRGFDIPQEDLLSHALHHAALAEMIVYVLREKDKWIRTEPKESWKSSTFYSPDETHLRRVQLVDYWNEDKLLSVASSWEILGEMAVYSVPLDLYVVSMGASRDGKRHGVFSKALSHPINRSLRFQKRDGTDFTKGWGAVYREQEKVNCEEWFEAMGSDGVLGDAIQIVTLEPPDDLKKVRDIIVRTLDKIESMKEIPDPQLAVCNLPSNPCPFRSACPYFREPSVQNGFIPRLL